MHGLKQKVCFHQVQYEENKSFKNLVHLKTGTNFSNFIVCFKTIQNYKNKTNKKYITNCINNFQNRPYKVLLK